MINLGEEYKEKIIKSEVSSVLLFDIYMWEDRTDYFVHDGSPEYQLSEKPIEATEIVKVDNGIYKRRRHDYKIDYKLNKIWLRPYITRSVNFLGETIIIERGFRVEVGQTIEVSYKYEKRLGFAQWSEALEMDGKKYEPIPIFFDQITYDVSGALVETNIVLSAQNNIVKEIFEKDPVNWRIVIHHQFVPIVAGTHIQFQLRVDSWERSEERFVLKCKSPLDVLLWSLPPRNYDYKCPWAFDSKECRYSTDSDLPDEERTHTSCDKYYTDCMERKNLWNFGGFDL